LSNSGEFELKFIEKEGIWFGKKVLEEEPKEEFCRFILPPEELNKTRNEEK
jgi:hypothetical protein